MNLNNLTRDQLIEMVEAEGIEIKGRPTKQQMIDLMEENENAMEGTAVKDETGEAVTTSMAAEELPLSFEEAEEPMHETVKIKEQMTPKAVKKASPPKAPGTDADEEGTYKTPSGREIELLRPTPVRSRRRSSLEPKPKTLTKTTGVITIEGKDKYTQKLSPHEKLKQEFVSSMDPKIRAILTGKLLGYANMELNGQRILLIKVAYKEDIVHITPEEYFPNYEAENSSFFIRSIEYRKGTPCSFLVDYIDPEYPDEGFVSGSRVKAMDKIKLKFWNSDTNEFDEDGKPLKYLRTGVIVEGKVLEVRPQGITIEIFGVESFVPSAELFYVHVNDARTLIKTGDTMNFFLKKVERTGTGRNLQVKFTASHKMAAENPIQKYFTMYNASDNVIGEVTQAYADNKDGKMKFFVNVNNQIDVFCTMSTGVEKIPAVGQNVDIVIRGKSYEKLWFWGEIIHVREE